MAISNGIGTVVSVGTVRTEAQRTASAYVSLTYTQIGSVESVSEVGDEGAVVNFTPLEDGRTRQLKGAISPGNVNITCADDPLDAGQIAMIAAASGRRLFPLKLLAADGADSNDTDSAIYVGVRVLSAKVNRGDNGVNKRVFACAIDTENHEVASTAVSGGT